MSVKAVIEVGCAEGRYPIEVELRFWGELNAPADPFSALGTAWGRMIPDECRQSYQRFLRAFESSALLMLERVLLQSSAFHENQQIALIWQAVIDALPDVSQKAQEILATAHTDTTATEWAIAVAGTEGQIADYLEQHPIREWHPANVQWLLRRALSGDRGVWKFLWEVLPQLRDGLQETASLVALAMGLGQSRSDRAWDTLEPLLNHSDIGVRTAAIEAVGALREPRARPYLRQALQNEPEAHVKETIIRTLGAVGEECDAVDLIDYALHHPSYRAVVRDALVQLGTTALTPIQDALRDTFDNTLCELLVDALHRMRIREAVPILSRVAQHAVSSKVRLRAVEALADLHFEEGIPALIVALGDVSERIRQVAVESLIRFGESAADTLLEHIETPSWSAETRYLAQWAAVRVVARIGGETVKQRLQSLAASYDMNQRWAALTAIRYADYPDLSEWVAQQIPNAPWTIQHECALYLHKYPHVETIPILMEELRNPHAAMQELLEAAVAANGVAAIPILQRHFEQWQTFTQRLALTRILRKIGHPAGTPLLERLAEDPDERIAKEARKAMQHISTGVPV